jgi:hypothetical protein
LEVVTMFQPARPSLRWSSEAKRRRGDKGSSKVVEAVAIRPMLLRHARQGGEQREGLERSDRMAALQRLDRHVQHGQVVGHEEGVEAPCSSVWARYFSAAS